MTWPVVLLLFAVLGASFAALFRREKIKNLILRTELETLVQVRTAQLQNSVSDLERSRDVTLATLGDALDLKTAENKGHAQRVTAFTIAIARVMELPKDEISVVARGAFLHDIGKLAIPDEILHDPRILTPEEVAIKREYCLEGYRIVKRIPLLADAAEIVYSHKEYYNGSGYPRGLSGAEIPLGARIVAVANALDAITTDRFYRAARSIRAARDEIRRRSGSQFDPRVVIAFLSLPEELWGDLRKSVDS